MPAEFSAEHKIENSSESHTISAIEHPSVRVPETVTGADIGALDGVFAGGVPDGLGVNSRKGPSSLETAGVALVSSPSSSVDGLGRVQIDPSHVQI